MAKIIIMNVGIDKTFLKFKLARKLLIIVKNAGSKNKRRRLMKNMKSPNSGLTVRMKFVFKPKQHQATNGLFHHNFYVALKTSG